MQTHFFVPKPFPNNLYLEHAMPVSPFSVTRSQNGSDARVDIKEPAASSAAEKVCQCPQLKLCIRD